jgi:hypothetical protein
MCTFQDERTVLVCPVASDQVCARLHDVFGDLVQCSNRSEQGTLIRVPSSIDPAHFQAVARAAIATAQNASPNPVGARIWQQPAQAARQREAQSPEGHR